jgi:excisionase family DNA binding protein
MNTSDKLAYSPTEAHQALGIGRSLLWRLLQNSEIKSIKLGSRRLIPADELHRFLASLPAANDNDAASS